MASAVRNTAIKRIQGDVREMMKDPSDQYHAAPLEDNMFDWHFTLRGPRDTEFEGGIYHGRILLPADYPFKPPNIMLLTPNGRFEVRKKICLSISAHHPEEWQPAWGIRLILEALISFMPTKGEGAIGALDYPPQERRRLAKLSVDYKCDVCGKIADLLPELQSEEDKASRPSKYAEQIAQLHMHSLENGGVSNSDRTPTESSKSDPADNDTSSNVPPNPIIGEAISMKADEAKDLEDSTVETPPAISPLADRTPESGTRSEPARQDISRPVTAPHPIITQGPDRIDAFLHYVTVVIAVALFAMIYKKLLQVQGILQ